MKSNYTFSTSSIPLEQPFSTTTFMWETFGSSTPLMMRVADCEGKTQFNSDGSVVRGVINHNDIGKFQINLDANGDKAKELGYDIFTLKGNVGFAKWLFDKQGTRPWVYSEKCWGKDLNKVAGRNI